MVFGVLRAPNIVFRVLISRLHMAAKLGFLDLVELLINYGADVGARDSEGNNPA